jgi:tetratricopeptide (TPR) repeat protein
LLRIDYVWDMKQVLKIGGLVLLNLILVFLAVLLYYRISNHIITTTFSPSGIEVFVAAPIISIGLLMFFFNKKFKQYGIGVTALFISCIVFSVFFLNKRLASEGKYKSYKLRNDNRWTDKGFFLNIEFNMWYNSTEVSIEKWLQVDSVHVRSDNGFFGWRVMNNEVRIVESSNCGHSNPNFTNLMDKYFAIANELRRKRCFSEAIDYYTMCIKLDSLSSDYFYERGLVFMVTEDYKNALNDFLTSVVLKNNELRSETVMFSDTVEIGLYIKRNIDKVKRQGYIDMGDYTENFGKTIGFANYQMRINFCLENLKEK